MDKQEGISHSHHLIKVALGSAPADKSDSTAESTAEALTPSFVSTIRSGVMPAALTTFGFAPPASNASTKSASLPGCRRA